MNRVREERRRQDLRVEDLAARAGVSYSTVHRVEAGGSPNLRVAYQLAGALGKSIGFLFPATEARS